MKYRDEYIKEDEFIVINNDDEDLFPFKVQLPKLDEWYSKILGSRVDYEESLTFVDGYGLAAKDQKFKHQIVPDKIKTIYETGYNKLKVSQKARYKDITDVTQEDIFNEIETNQKYYDDEIKWIKKQIKRRFVGYWCFIKGKPTFINGAFYYFLNFWKIKNNNRKDSLPDYRNYQRIMFSAMLYSHTTDELFFKHRVNYRDENSKSQVKYFNDWEALVDFCRELAQRSLPYFAQKNVSGGIIINSGKRTINGINFISARRIAKTASACCFGVI